MKKTFLILIGLMLLSGMLMADTSTYTATQTGTATGTRTSTSTATGTYTATITGSVTNTLTSSVTYTPLRTNTQTLTVTQTKTPTTGASQTATSTASTTATSTNTPTQSPTATTYMQTTDMIDTTVVDASTNGVTKTALADSTWAYYQLSCKPISNDFASSATDFTLTAPNSSTYTYTVLRKIGYVEIHVTDRVTGNKVNLSSNGIKFHLIAIRKNYDY